MKKHLTGYSNSGVRRQDRLLSEKYARILREEGEYGVLSMYCSDSGIYGIPINYVWNGDKYIFLHCAPEGKKLKIIDVNNAVSFCVVGKTNIVLEKFTTEYESIVLECCAVRNLSEEEKMYALSLLLDKYSPEDKENGMNFARNSLYRTDIIRLEIIKWSGKCKGLRSAAKD